jgi:hypothetical protein
MAIPAERGRVPVDDRDERHPRRDRRARCARRAGRGRGAARYGEDSRHQRGRQAGPQDQAHNASMTVPIPAHIAETRAPGYRFQGNPAASLATWGWAVT